MRRFDGLVVVGAALIAGGCSSGDDVYVETQGAQISALCTLAPGDDVCARDWSAIPLANRAAATALAETAVTLAGIARDALEVLDAACGQVLVDLAVTPPSTAPATARARARASCTAAAAQLETVSAGVVTVQAAPAVCTQTPRSACARPGARPLKTCAPPTVSIDVGDRATAADRRIAAALQNSLGRVLHAHSDVEAAAAFSSEITGNANEIQELSAECVPPLLRLTVSANEEIQEANELAGLILAAVAPR